MTEKKEIKRILLPEGRIINHSLFVKDQFNDDATPGYKIEMAFEPDDLDPVEGELAAAALAKWGAGADDAYYDEKIISPVLYGDRLAQRREEKGKQGDAYMGKLVIRAHTIFNKHGQDGPGGVQVYGPDVAEIGGAQAHEIYAGCYGQAVVTIGTYDESRSGDHALMFYLSAFQKTRDGEPLVSAADHSEMFKPVGRDQEGGTGGRRRRKG